MITPAYSITATERVLPKMALDFTTATLDARVTFTRALGTATRVNSSGVVASVAADTPRFDYDPTTLACQGLLIEESRVNIFLQSQTYSAANWTKTGLTSATGSSGTSPDGTNNAFFLTEDSSSGAHGVAQDISATNTVVYTATYFVKAGTRTWCSIFGQGSAFSVAPYASFNIGTGTLGSFGNGASNVSITPYGNGWYRISMSATASASSVATLALRMATGNINFTYVGDGTSGIYVWGAQFEAGAFATSYIPTTTAALTRNADVATMTGTNFSNWWRATTGASTISAIPMSISGINPLFQMDDNTADNIINLRGNVANPELYIKATTDQAQIDAGTIVANTAYKLSGAWNTDNCAASQNGVAVVTDNTVTIPTVTQARIGSDGTNYANAWLQKIFYYPQRLINTEVQAFSK